jgi:hypothetical protein
VKLTGKPEDLVSVIRLGIAGSCTLVTHPNSGSVSDILSRGQCGALVVGSVSLDECVPYS